MRIDVVTVFPEMVQAVATYGVTARAVTRGLLQVQTWSPRDYAADRHRRVDDRPYGGGPGMVMRVEPLRGAIAAARAEQGGSARTVGLSPQGRPLDQAAMAQLAGAGDLLLIAGRYEGIDERLVELEVDEEWSIGDYVLSGGELAAMVLIDGLARLLPGALGAKDSALQDSFSAGLLDCPHYTRPEVVAGLGVPPVLLTGNHAEIRRWRLKQALGRTAARRPDLLAARELGQEERALLEEYVREREACVGLR